MKVRKSLRSLKAQSGAQVVRRRGVTFVLNKKNPRFKARQGWHPEPRHRNGPARFDVATLCDWPSRAWRLAPGAAASGTVVSTACSLAVEVDDVAKAYLAFMDQEWVTGSVSLVDGGTLVVWAPMTSGSTTMSGTAAGVGRNYANTEFGAAGSRSSAHVLGGGRRASAPCNTVRD